MVLIFGLLHSNRFLDITVYFGRKLEQILLFWNFFCMFLRCVCNFRATRVFRFEPYKCPAKKSSSRYVLVLTDYVFVLYFIFYKCWVVSFKVKEHHLSLVTVANVWKWLLMNLCPYRIKWDYLFWCTNPLMRKMLSFGVKEVFKC